MTPELMTLFTTGNLLGSVFLGGIVGNLAASFLWDGTKWVCKPVLNQLPEIGRLFAEGGSQNNHDLLRALRRAECRVVVSLCDQALLDDFGLRTGKGPVLERLQARLRERKDPEIRALCRIRRVFAQTYDDLQSLSVDNLKRMYGGVVDDVPALITAGSECFVAENPDQLRETVVRQQVMALDRAVRGTPGRARLSATDPQPLAPDGLPPSLKQRMEQHPQGWWDLLRLAFREELKDPANERALTAWNLDVQSRLSQQLGQTLDELEEKFADREKFPDEEKLVGVWDDLKSFRQSFDNAIVGIMDLLEAIDTKVDQLHERFDRVEELAKQRALRPPLQLPNCALAGKFFGREVLLTELKARLKRREHVDIWGPAGMGKTALAAEAIRAVVGDDPDHLSTTPYPDGVVLLDLYGLKFTSLESIWDRLTYVFDESLSTEQSARDRAATACRGRRALVVVEGAEEAGSGSTLQQLLAVLAPETTRVILTRDKQQVSTPRPLMVEATLERDEALALLRELCAATTDETIITQVYARLGGHPFALTSAGFQLAAGEESPRAFLRDLEAAQLPDLHQPGYEDHTLRWLFERSVLRLPPEWRRMLAAAGLLARQPFPLSAALAVFDGSEAATRQALKQLVRHGLLRILGGEDEQWELTHALVHQFAGTMSDSSLLGKLGAWARAYFTNAVEQVRRTSDFSRLRHALDHAGSLLRADREADLLAALQVELLYDGSEQIWALGRLDFARDASVAVHDWLVRALARRPDDLALQRDLSVSHDRIGNSLQAQGAGAEALTAYRQSLAIRERLAQHDPTNTEWQRDLSVSHERIGDSLQAQGAGAEALTAYRQSLAIRERLAQHDPTNTQWQRDLVVSYTKLGQVPAQQGKRAQALQYFDKARAISARLTQLDQSNAVWRNDLAWIEKRIAELQQSPARE